MHQLKKQNIPIKLTQHTAGNFDSCVYKFISLPEDVRTEVTQAIRQELGAEQTLDGACIRESGALPISIEGGGFLRACDLDYGTYLYLNSPKLKIYSMNSQEETFFIHSIFGEKCVNLQLLDLVTIGWSSFIIQGVSPTIKLTKGAERPNYTSLTIQGCVGGSLVLEDVIRIDRLSLIDCPNFNIFSNQPFLSVGHIELKNSSVSGLIVGADSGYQCENSKSSVSIMISTESELQGYRNLIAYEQHKMGRAMEGDF
jgi:hypothetical protein